MDCLNFADFEKKMNTVRNNPYWHPHAHTIIYFHGEISQINIGKMFFILWYYHSCNSILVQYNDDREQLMATYYSPYINKNYKLDHHFGCWTRRKPMFPITSFQDSFICTEGCINVTGAVPLRMNHFGTCIGIKTNVIHYTDSIIPNTNYFEDKGKNLQGFSLTAYVNNAKPFLMVQEKDGSYTLHRAHGLIFTEMAKVMNFHFDFTPSLKNMNDPYSVTLNVERVQWFGQRKVDLLILPIYMIDLIFVDLDLSIPFQDSGLCYMSHVADFETNIFDTKLLQSNGKLFLTFIICFVGTWFTIFVFKVVEMNTFTLNQMGKDLSNTFRSLFSLSLFNPPQQQSFRIFLAISIWSFFVLNFATQAAITSFFTVYKRGKDVDTFEEIAETGYKIEGIGTLDALLPETKDTYKIINSRLVPINDLYGCVNTIQYDRQKFCLLDCSMARYYARNYLNSRGEPYIHIARNQVHSHYLIFLLPKNSALSNQFNKYLYKFIEAGLIGKWLAYLNKIKKQENLNKALSPDDLVGVFKFYCLLTGITIIIFLLECSFVAAKILIYYLKLKYSQYRQT
jgi:hypothetical protein